MAAENWTLEQILDQLNTGNKWANNQITYSFPSTSDLIYTGQGEASGFRAFTFAQANMAKLLASEASWQAANVCLDTHGGFGFAKEYDVERKFREARLYKTAPVNQNLVTAYIAEHVLGLPRSY